MKHKIKQLLSLILTICLLLSSLPFTASAESAKTADIEIPRSQRRGGTPFAVGDSGSYVIAAYVEGVYYAMSSSFSGKINGTPIAVTDGYVAEADAAGYTVTLTYSGGSYTIRNDTHYLSYSSSTNLGATTTAYTWTISEGVNGSWRITASTADTRGVVFRAKTYNQFGAYALSNAKEGATEYFDVEILPVGSIAGGSTTESFVRVTSASQLTAGRYVIMFTPTVSDSPYSYYVLNKIESDQYYAMQVLGTGLTSLTDSITAPEDVVWTFTGSSNAMTVGDGNGKYLYNDPSSPNSLSLTDTASSWVVGFNSSKSAFTFKSTYYMSYMDNTEYVGGNELPMVFCWTDTTGGNPYFYLYKATGGSTACSHSSTSTSTTEATCTENGQKVVTCNSCGKVISTTSLPATGHSYQYSSNHNGTHKVTCFNCSYSKTEDCKISSGKCSACRWVSGSVSSGTFTLITSANQIKDGSYVLVVAPGGANPGAYPYYAITRQMHSTSYVMAEGLSMSSIPQTLTVNNETMIWNLSGDSKSFTLAGPDGSVLYNSSNNLYYGEGIATSWVAEATSGTFTLNADGRYLGLRDDLTTVDSNGNPCFRCNSAAKTSSYQFYLFKSGTVDAPSCSHENTSNDLTPSTCTESGRLIVTCNDCGEVVSDEIVEAQGHNASYVEGVAAGCNHEGRIPHYVCTRCNRLFSDTLCINELKESALVVPPVGHEVFAVGGLEATCGTDGMMAHYQCYGCGTLFLDDKATQSVILTDLTIPSLGHDLIETPATPASCALEGNIAYFTCDVCNAIFSDETCETQIYLVDTVIPALNHTLSHTPVIEASCTASGVYAYYYCSICDIYYSDNDYTETISKEDLYIAPLGHDVQYTNRIEPACTESGMLAHYYCNRCHSLFSDADCKNSLTQDQIRIAPTGHSYVKTVTPATCTEQGRENYTCSACGEFYSSPIEATGHTMVNGTCSVCGYSDGVVDTSIVINHTLNLASDISINFAVKASLLEAYDSFYLEVKIPVYSGNVLQNYRTVTVQPELNGSYYYFVLTGVTAIQMGDEVQAILHMTKAGVEAVSPTDYYSVSKYAYSQLDKSAAKESLKALCANLLRYGTAAQVYKNYRTDSYVDAAMTDVHRAYLTDLETVTLTDYNRTIGDLANPTVLWQGKALIMDSKITLKYVINTAGFSGNVNDLSLVLRYQDYTGAEKVVTLTNPVKYGTKDTWYAFDFDGLLAAELRQVISAAIYHGETRVSQTLEYSVESYGCGRTGDLLAVCKAMIAYSDMALAFFQN